VHFGRPHLMIPEPSNENSRYQMSIPGNKQKMSKRGKAPMIILNFSTGLAGPN